LSSAMLRVADNNQCKINDKQLDSFSFLHTGGYASIPGTRV